MFYDFYSNVLYYKHSFYNIHGMFYNKINILNI